MISAAKNHVTKGTIMAFSFEKMEAVRNAVIAQLRHDWRPVNDLHAVMQDDLKYDKKPLSIFLNTIEEMLFHHVPSYDFEFDPEFVLNALPLTVEELMQEINQSTA
jgi:hypothetical protein